MDQLTDDVKELKSMGFISIARQYGRMARCLSRLQRYAYGREQSRYMLTVVAEVDKALRRFDK